MRFECIISRGNLKHGILSLKVDNIYYPAIKLEVKKLLAKKDDKPLQCELKSMHRKRTLDQNAMMFALCTLIAWEHNAGLGNNETMKRDAYEIYKEIEQLCAPKQPGITGVETIKPLKLCNTIEFAPAIEWAFDWLSEYGVDARNQYILIQHLKSWKQKLNDDKIILNKDMKDQQYAEAVKYCEACWKYLGVKGEPDYCGNIAHIKSRGMGGRENEESKNTANKLHLCVQCHIAFDNGRGRDRFVEKNKHLRYKIETALKQGV